MTDSTQNVARPSSMRYVIVAVIVLGAFFGAYSFAAARSGGPASGGAQLAGAVIPATADSSGAGAPAGGAGGGAGGGSGCACCGSSAPTEGGITGDLAEGTAKISGDVQTIEVDVSKGYYQPNQIVLKAGVPTEITFGQGSGCTGQVMSQELGFYEDVSTGPKTVKLPALEKGEYPFYCGMQMVFGKIVVK